MPAGPNHQEQYQSNETAHDQSAASILQSVKEQEAQFEQLTRELEAERQSVANQLERCKFGSETASMSSISSTDESFHWRPPPKDANIDEESDADSKVSGSQLVDSCLRVLQERGLMGNIGEDPSEYLPNNPNTSQSSLPHKDPYQQESEPQEQNSGIYNVKTKTIVNNNTMMNGPGSIYDSAPVVAGQESHHSTHRTVTTVTKVTTKVHHVDGTESPVPQDSFYSQQYNVDQQNSSRLNVDASMPATDSPSSFPPYNGVGSERMEGHNASSYDDSSYIPQEQEQSYSVRQEDHPTYHHHQHDNYDHGNHPLDSYNPDGEISYDHGRGGSPTPEGASPHQEHAYHSLNYSHQGLQDQADAAPYERLADATDPAGQKYFSQPGDESFDPQFSYSDQHHGSSQPNGPPYQPQVNNEDPYSHHGYSRDNGDPYSSAPAHLNDSLGPHGSNHNVANQGPADGPIDRVHIQQYHSSAVVESERLSEQAPSDSNHYGNRPEDASFSDRGGSNVPYAGYSDNNVPQEDPYGSRHDTRPVENPYVSRPTVHPPQEDPYGNRSPTSQDEDPYARFRQPEDPYGSHRGLQSQEDPYGSRTDTRSVPESPYGKKSDQPYPPHQDPYNRPPEDPYGSQQDNRYQASPQPADGSKVNPTEDPSQRSQSPASSREQRFRDPDLPEVIEYLSHPNPSIKANAAAYLQHLTYMDDSVKSKTRTLGGIPALVELVNNEIPEVHRASCGALRNLSYGRANSENKRAIKNTGGIPALVRLLRRSPDNDVRELVTGILWNLSSCPDLKKPIIDEGLSTIVDTVIIPHSGWDPSQDDSQPMQPAREVYWSTVFRNASGVLRNVSSDGEYARKKLRECRGLPDSILYIVQAAIGKNDIDNKSVENCVCILRNLSYACQEVEDAKYLDKRDAEKKKAKSGKEKKKKDKKDSKKDAKKQQDTSSQPSQPPPPPKSGKEMLWHPNVVHIYLPLLTDCTNPETLEAAAGAIQNLAACDWQPSSEVREAVRREKGLPIMVELLNLEADRVVCAAATALRNLALDTRNKELIGKYAMKQLVNKLPQERPSVHDYALSDDTICAVEATLYEVVRRNPDFAQSMFQEGGVERLIHITNSRGKYSSKVVKFASTLLHQMWQFKELHLNYKQQGYTEKHFITRTMAAKAQGDGGPSAVNTLDRPRMDQSGPTVAGVNEHTLPHIQRTNQQNINMGYDDGQKTPQMNHSYSAGNPNYDTMPQGEEIQMQNIGAGSIHGSTQNVPSGSPFYASIGQQQKDDKYIDQQEGPPQYDPHGNQPDGYGQHPDNYSQQGGNYASQDQYNQQATYTPHDNYGDSKLDNYSQQGGNYAAGQDNYSQQGGQYDDQYGQQQGHQYAPNDSYDDKDSHRGDYRPAPMVPGSAGAQDPPEPIYSKPNKVRKNPSDQHLALDGAPPGGADSWV